ncbi:MAG: 50S ribosomal protein L25/general stress protein Ctc [Bacteroidales bacterium]
MSGAPRAHVGKKDAKKHRREGRIPCVLYGGAEQVHFTVDEKEFSKLIFTPEVYIIELTVEGKTVKAILQDVQYHPVTDRVLHADFLETVEGKPVTVALPIHLEGNAPGVIAGGKLIKKMRKLVVKGMVDDLPEFITVDISKLKLGSNIKIRDISVSGLELLDPPSSVIVAVKTARGALADVAEEEGEEAEGEGGGEAPAEESQEG